MLFVILSDSVSAATQATWRPADTVLIRIDAKDIFRTGRTVSRLMYAVCRRTALPAEEGDLLIQLPEAHPGDMVLLDAEAVHPSSHNKRLELTRTRALASIIVPDPLRRAPQTGTEGK